MEKAQKQELEYMDELQAALRMRPATPVYVLLFIIMAFRNLRTRLSPLVFINA